MRARNKITKLPIVIQKEVIPVSKHITINDEIDPNNIEVLLNPKEQEAFINIIISISEGNSLFKALETIKGITKPQMYRCINLDAEKRNIYARACLEREKAMFESTLTIAVDTSNDMYMNDKGVLVPNPVAVQRARLQCDVIDKMLARMNHKKYGAKSTVSGDKDNPIVIQAITGMIIE